MSSVSNSSHCTLPSRFRRCFCAKRSKQSYSRLPRRVASPYHEPIDRILSASVPAFSRDSYLCACTAANTIGAAVLDLLFACSLTWTFAYPVILSLVSLWSLTEAPQFKGNEILYMEGVRRISVFGELASVECEEDELHGIAKCVETA